MTKMPQKEIRWVEPCSPENFVKVDGHQIEGIRKVELERSIHFDMDLIIVRLELMAQSVSAEVGEGGEGK